MLIPNGTLEEVYEKPNIGWSKRPVFSMSTEAEIDTFLPGQFVDLTGDGRVFVFEDVRPDRRNFDGDYNDFVFSVSGLEGSAASVEEYINPDKDWRSSDNGIEFLEIVNELVNGGNEAPTITVELANDTGEDDTDKITTDPSLTGTVIDEGEVVSFEISRTGVSPVTGDSDSFVEVTTELESDGSFVLERETLESVLGETLPLGLNTVYLRATDEEGLESEVVEFEFTLEEEDLLGPEIESMAGIYGLDAYPDGIALPPTGTRQLSVKIDNWANSPELTADVGDISYVVEDGDVLEVSPEGLVTGKAGGETNVTVQYGDAEITIPVLVEPPEMGPSLVDGLGGVVFGEEDWLVMAPPGALIEETEIDISPLAESELSLDVPPNYSFVTGFELELGENPLNLPVQLAIPAPEDVEPGTEVFFMYEGEIPDATGEFLPMWVVQESGIVGEDGMIRTQSPPWEGVHLTGEYSVVIPDFEYSVAHVELALLNHIAGIAMIGAGVASIAVNPKSLKGIELAGLDLGTINPAFWGVAGRGLIGLGAFSLATVPILLDAAQKSVTAITIPQVGLPYETESGVQLNPGQFCCGSLTVDLPPSPIPDALALTKVEVTVPPPPEEGNNEIAGRVVFLEGENFGEDIEDLEVNFHQGGKVYPGTILPSDSGLTDLESGKIAVVSDYVPLGEASVSLEKTLTSIIGTQTIQETESVELPVERRVELALTTMNLGDRINAINALNPLEVIDDDPDVLSSKDLLLASIPVGTPDGWDRPRYTAVTSEATRAYVTLESSKGVALVDLQGFKQLDTQQDVEGVNPIALPPDSSPRPIVIDPKDSYAYIGDGQKGRIYVIDIDPSSAEYNEHVETIEVGDAPAGLKKLAISSDGKRLFATAPDQSDRIIGKIFAVNVDPEDRPVDGDVNRSKWHQTIGEIEAGKGPEGITATSDGLKMAFTNRYDESKGYGVLTIVDNDPNNFQTEINYAQMSVVGPFDTFDVNEAVDVEVVYDEETDTDYAFVAGRNLRNLTLGFSWHGKSNIGIFKDALGDNPQLVAATRQIPYATASDVAVSSDGRFLFAAYPGIESTLAFDVGEIIETINSPDPLERKRLEKEPIDLVNPDVSLAADLEIVRSNAFTREVEWRVPEGSDRGPISTGSLPWGVQMASNQDLIKPATVDGKDLTPTLTWEILKPKGESPQPPGEGEGDGCVSCGGTPEDEENIESVRLYLSTFDKNNGLLPERWNPDVPQEFWDTEDYNPNRILTAQWRNGQWKWPDGSLIPNVEEEEPNTFEQFILPEERMLTGGQTYHWAVKVKWKDAAKAKPQGNEEQIEIKQFDTKLPAEESDIPQDDRKRFSSVTVLTPGFEPPPENDIVDFPEKTVDAMAAQLEDAGAVVMRYRPQSQNWSSVTYNDRFRRWDASNKAPEKGKPLVLVADWKTGLKPESFWNAGVAEAAADNLFASIAKLDLDYGAKVGEENRLYDPNGDLIREHGAVFNAPLHFIGFGQGAVVNTEIIQRLGTYFPKAGGFQDDEERDLHMTTVDPFEYNPETVPQFGSNFARMLDPEIVVWDNVTYADNYYQVQGKNGDDDVLIGKKLEKIPDRPDRPGRPDRADINYELKDWAGFDRAKAKDNAHRAAVAWYGGTANVNDSQIPVDQQLVFRRLGDLLGEELDDPLKSWFVPGHTKSSFNHGDTEAPWEGIGTGWFYSVNGGGDKLRPYEVDGEPKPKGKEQLGDFKDYLKENRLPVTYDNTYTDNDSIGTRMRGDDGVSTLFNGNFDVTAGSFRNQEDLAIPGWSVPVRDSEKASQKDLFPWHKIRIFQNNDYLNRVGYNQNKPNYAFFLRTDKTKKIVHNNFVVPEWGDLRFNLLAPAPRGKLKVYMETPPPSGVINWDRQLLETIDLSQNAINELGQYKNNIYKIGFAREGFETFHVPVDDRYRGKIARLAFELEGNNAGVILDDVFFSSVHLKFGNPSEARFDSRGPNQNPYRENLLIEKPQYALSYNRTTKTPNWVSWQVNPSWIGGERQAGNFIADPTLPNGWPQISGQDYEYFDPERNQNLSLGLDKGHTIPSGDRTGHFKDNLATFLGTNLFPQSIDNNRFFYTQRPSHDPTLASSWYNLEYLTRNFVGKFDRDGNLLETPKEVYVVAGSVGTNWKPQDPRSNAVERERTKGATKSEVFEQRKINIPKLTWKTILALDSPRQGITDVTQDTQAYAFLTPNIPEPYHKNEEWSAVTHPFDTMEIGGKKVSEQLGLENAGELPKIQNAVQWRSPQTWQVTLQELENLLKTYDIELLSNLPKDIKDAIKEKKYNLPNP